MRADEVDQQPLAPDEVAAWRGFLAWTEGVTSQVEQALTAASGLSAADLHILLRVRESGGSMLQQALQADSGWSATRLSHQLARMQQRGYIVRTAAGAGSGRAMQVQLSPEGDDVLEASRRPHAAAVRRHLLDGLTAEQRRVLVEFVRPGASTADPGPGAEVRGRADEPGRPPKAPRGRR